MYLVKIKITVEGYKSMVFSGVYNEKEKSRKKVDEIKKACCEKIREVTIRSNANKAPDSLLESVKNAKVEIIEWKKRRLDFGFTEEILFNK